MSFLWKFSVLLRRNYTTKSRTRARTVPKVRAINKVDSKYRAFVINESQKALTEYLHSTRSVPFYMAEKISKNSPFALSTLVTDVHFSSRTFPATIRRLLAYEPIDEFEFFLESIGIDHLEVTKHLPLNKHFLSEDKSLLESALALCHFGFPWHMLGRLYTHQSSIFAMSLLELNSRLDEIRESGVSNNIFAVGVCLAFPHLLSPPAGASEPLLFEDLKRVFEELDKRNVDVDNWVDLCCKVRVFYELGCKKGAVGQAICNKMSLILDFPKHIIDDKVDYFCKFCDGRNEEVGQMLLRNPEIFALDLDSPVISVSGVLERFGLGSKELSELSSKYPHVFGRNKMRNLPCVTRALDLNEWFFDKIKSSDFRRLATCTLNNPDQDADKDFMDEMKRKKSESSRAWVYRTSKLECLKRIGFGENGSTISVLRGLKVNAESLQERFDFLLGLGIKYSKLCSLVKISPAILHQSSELLKGKIDYLCNEMESSLEYLDCFPRFLFHNLENRIKPRHRFYVWLRDLGFYTEDYSIKTVIDCSEKRFIAHLSKIHPSVPKHYLESFLQIRSNNDGQEIW